MPTFEKYSVHVSLICIHLIDWLELLRVNICILRKEILDLYLYRFSKPFYYFSKNIVIVERE